MSDSQWYNDFYTAVEKSKAYTEYCVKVFGQDFSQQGFSNMQQINFMLDKLKMQPGDHILDIGCGNGKMIEYISDSLNIIGYGFDISSTAIDAARFRTVKKVERLTFDTGSIGAMQYHSQSFDVVLSMDTLYFADNLTKTIHDICQWLKPCGKIATFFSEFRFSDIEPLDKLTPDGSGLARVLQKEQIEYEVFDFTKSHYDCMKLKKKILVEMKQKFEAEDTVMLYDNAYTESIEDAMSYDDFRKFSSRYLYIIKRP